MLNMDMISRNDPREMYMAKLDQFQKLNDLVDSVASRFSIFLNPKGMDKYVKRSDQWPFIQKGVPAVFMFGGNHPQYHTEHDDVELANPVKMVNIARLMFLCAYECANYEGSFRDDLSLSISRHVHGHSLSTPVSRRSIEDTHTDRSAMRAGSARVEVPFAKLVPIPLDE